MFFEKYKSHARRVFRMFGGNTNTVYGTTDADTGVGIGLKGGFNNLIKKAIN